MDRPKERIMTGTGEESVLRARGLLHLLGGLDRPTGGELWLAGQHLSRMGERALARQQRDVVGFVFQAFHLMDELTAVENVELPALLLPGALVGVPLGIGLFAAANGAGVVTVPPAPWLLGAVLGTLLVLAGLTTIPARIGTRRSVAEILQSETA
jgi:hypothetical protein